MAVVTPALVDSAAALRIFHRLTERWGLARSAQAALLDVPERTYYRWLDAPARINMRRTQLERISHLLAIQAALGGIFTDGQDAVAWLRRPNPILGGQVPLERITAGTVADIIAVREHVERRVW
jgi:uncharacterized protein (DUF2384 family)